MLNLRSVGITCKSDLDDQNRLLEQIIEYFCHNNIQVYVDYRVDKRFSKKCLVKRLDENNKIDLLVAVGGDGTMLRSVQEHLLNTKLFFGINMGHLGFLAEVPPDNFQKVFNSILHDHCNIDERDLLKISVMRQRKKVKSFLALNEVVISQIDDVVRLIKLKTEVSKKKLATYFADGLIVSTPTGSTAYNLSVGGPIIHPQVQAFVISPINPHSFSQKPIVIPNNKVIYVYSESSRKQLNITTDGQISYSLQENDTIRISKYHTPVRFVRLYEESYYKTLRRKLGWG